MTHKSFKQINVNGQLLDFSSPRIMGILNLTPDSFFAASRKQTEKEIAEQAVRIVEQGGSIIDIGAYSSRPNADHIDAAEEMARLRKGLQIVTRECPDAIISIDTFRADVARMCVEEFGAGIINDIAAGSMDAEMFPTIARLNVPYIIMHMQGTPQTMQQHPHYENVVKEVLFFFSEKIRTLHSLGVKDIIVDPGFGFGKTLTHNYELLAGMQCMDMLNSPILVGVSRKSMIYKLLDITPDEALNGSTVVHTLALMKGADILRVHDVKAASEAVRIVEKLRHSSSLTSYK